MVSLFLEDCVKVLDSVVRPQLGEGVEDLFLFSVSCVVVSVAFVFSAALVGSLVGSLVGPLGPLVAFVVVVASDLVACNWTVVWDLGGLGGLGDLVDLGACSWTVVCDPCNVMEPCCCLVDPCILVAFGLVGHGRIDCCRVGSRCCCSGGGGFGVAVLVHGCCEVVLDRPIHNLLGDVPLAHFWRRGASVAGLCRTVSSAS